MNPSDRLKVVKATSPSIRVSAAPQQNINVAKPGQNSQTLNVSGAAYKPTPQKSPDFLGGIVSGIGNYGRDIASSIQQVGGNIADIGLQGSAVVNEIGRNLNPFINDQQRDAQRVADVRNIEAARNAIKATKTINGESLNPYADYKPTGDIGKDFWQLAGRGLQTGLDATAFINPARVGAKALFEPGLKTVGKDIIGSSLGLGLAQGLATGSTVYGQTGDMNKALSEGAGSGAVAAASQGVLGTFGHVVGNLLSKVGSPAQKIARSTNAKSIDGQLAKLHPEIPDFERQVLSETLAGIKDKKRVQEILTSLDAAKEKIPVEKVLERGTEPPAVNDNGTALDRKKAAEAEAQQLAQQAADAKQAQTDATLAPAKDPNSIDYPTFQAQKDFEAFAAKENEKLNALLNNNPDLTPQQIEAAKQAAADHIKKTFDEMQAARAKSVEAEQATPQPAPDNASVEQAAKLQSGTVSQTVNGDGTTTPKTPDSSKSSSVADAQNGVAPLKQDETPTNSPADGNTRTAVNKVFTRDDEFDRGTPLLYSNAKEEDLIDALGELRSKPVNERSSTDLKRIKNIEEELKSRRDNPTSSSEISKGEKPKNAPVDNKTKSTRYASETVPKSENVSSETGKITKENAPTYTPETEKARLEASNQKLESTNLDSFEQDVHNRLDQNHIDSQTVSDAQAVAMKLDDLGGEANQRRASDIFSKLSEHLTKVGQTIQAAAIMARRNPNGMKFQAMRDIARALNVNIKDVPKDISDKINSLVEEIKKTDAGSEARKGAVYDLSSYVSSHIPKGTSDNAISVWKAGLISGAKTIEGNTLSNTTFGLLNKASSPVAVAADKAMSFITGKRTTTLTQKGSLKGLKEGGVKGYDTLTTGKDVREITDKYELHGNINFKNKTVQKWLGNPAQKVFDWMSAQDQPFYYAQLKNSMYDMAKADGVNKGLRGKELSKYMDETVSNPSDELMQRATDEANKAILSYDTFASKAISSAHTGIDKMTGVSDAGKASAHAILNILAPFVRIPSAFLSRSVDFTPLGVGKEVISQISKGKFDQRDLSKAIGDGMTGTGVIVLGSALAQNGMLSGDYPNDQKEQQRWKAQGIQPNSVKIGDTWYSLDYLGPIGMLLGAGKKFNDAAASGSDALGSVSAAIAGFGQTLLGQSFLQGLSGFIDAAKDPTRYLENYINSQAGSTVPAIVNDFANLTDGFKRDVNNGWEAIINRIPLARTNLKEKQDVYGNSLKNDQSPLYIANALRPSKESDNPVIQEVGRLSQVDPNNADLQVTPTPVQKTIDVGGKTIKLDDNQQYELQNKVGQSVQAAWGELMKTDVYKALSDLDKANALNKLRQDVSYVNQRQFIEDAKLGTYTTKLTTRQQAIANGTYNVADYAVQKGTKVASNPKVKKTSTKAAGSGRSGSNQISAHLNDFLLPSSIGSAKSGIPTFSAKARTTKKLSVNSNLPGKATKKISIKL